MATHATRKVEKPRKIIHPCSHSIFVMSGIHTILVACDRDQKKHSEHQAELRGRTVAGPGGVSLNVMAKITWRDPIA